MKVETVTSEIDAFVKKENKIPKKEIDLAIERLKILA
jgi:hypothetical protein